jgi:hypothetical protein
MRRLITTAAILVAASHVHIDNVSLLPLAAPASARLQASELRRGQDRVAEIVAATRKALGGEDKLTALKALTAEGAFRRSMGGREMDGSIALTIVRPDKLKRVEEMQMGGMVGGPSIERTSVLAGNTAWDDMANRGGMGGGMQIVMREGPPPGAGGPGAPAPPTPEQLNEARVRRMRVDLHRLTAALLADAGTSWVDAGIAESPDGKADILETKEETGRTLRLFIDQETQMPLMLQYQDPKPMVMINGGPGRGPGGPGRGPGAPGGAAPGQEGTRPTPEEMQKRIAEMQRTPPALGTFSMHLSDYKKVDGIMLPHKIETELDGQPNEEWTIEKYKVNPTIKPDTWEKK